MLSKYWTISSKPLADANPNILEMFADIITGECVVHNFFLTINPNQKPMLSSSIQPGQHLEDDAVGVVIKSNRTDIEVGDVVVHRKGMRQFAEIDEDDLIQRVPWQDIDPSLYLSVLGTPGKTAWVSMTEIMKLEPGMTVGISGCSGTVGVLLAQMALKKDCTVIGYTSTQEKADWLETLGVKAIVSSNTTIDRLDKATKELVPDGFDAYHENVDNVHLLNAISNMKLNGTIALCGLMKTYTQHMGPGPNLLGTIYKNVNIQGFAVNNYKESLLAHFHNYMEDKYTDFKFKQHTVTGIMQVPAVYSDLYNAYGKGKLIIKI
jgi:NADPH-dependent curcumin reductase CurA